MKRSVRFMMAAVLLAVAAGCSNVKSTQMLGTPLSDEKASEFEGVWSLNDVLPVYVGHRGGGDVQLAFVQWDDEAFKLVEFTGTLTSDDDVTYLNVESKVQTEGEPTMYQFVRVKAAGEDRVFVHPANDEGFATAVNDGQLSGSVAKKKLATEVRIDATADELAEFVHPEKAGQQFNLEASAYLHRLTQFDEKNE
jgi:hypothetical protein